MDALDFINKRNSIVVEAFEQSDRPMIVLDRQGRVILASDGAGVLFGVARAELVGQDIYQYFLRPEALQE